MFHESTQPLFESDFGKDQQVHTMRSLRSVRKTVPCQSAIARFFGNRHNRCFLVQKAQNRFCSRTRRKKSRISPLLSIDPTFRSVGLTPEFTPSGWGLGFNAPQPRATPVMSPPRGRSLLFNVRAPPDDTHTCSHTHVHDRR